MAYIVCAHFRLDTGEREFPYVAGWAKDPVALKNMLAMIQTASASAMASLVLLVVWPKLPRARMVPAPLVAVVAAAVCDRRYCADRGRHSERGDKPSERSHALRDRGARDAAGWRARSDGVPPWGQLAVAADACGPASERRRLLLRGPCDASTNAIGNLQTLCA